MAINHDNKDIREMFVKVHRAAYVQFLHRLNTSGYGCSRAAQIMKQASDAIERFNNKESSK